MAVMMLFAVVLEVPLVIVALAVVENAPLLSR